MVDNFNLWVEYTRMRFAPSLSTIAPPAKSFPPQEFHTKWHPNNLQTSILKPAALDGASLFAVSRKSASSLTTRVIRSSSDDLPRLAAWAPIRAAG